MQPIKDAKATDYLVGRSPLSPNRSTTPAPKLFSEPLLADKSLAAKYRFPQSSWLQAGALTGAAAGVMVPLGAEHAIAYQPGPAETIPPLQAAQKNRNAVADAVNQSQAVLAQTSQLPQASFSASSSSTASSAASSSASSKKMASASLIKQAEDGSWTLAVPTGTETQSIGTPSSLREPAPEVTSEPVCEGRDCKGLVYINQQLPKAQRRLRDIQTRLQTFEADHAQQNMTAYQKVLSNRLSEIIQQKSKLTLDVDRTQQRIENLKQQLVSMDAEVGLAQKALSQSPEYQDKWSALQRIEQALLEEFSKANINATALNEIYGDYDYGQQALQSAATEALGIYLMKSDTVIPSFIQRVPAALSVVQSLVTATHDQQVQQLRQETINSIEQKLKTRQSQLAGNLGEYERLQREERFALAAVSQYETERQTMAGRQRGLGRSSLAASSSESLGSERPSSERSLGLARAKKLAPQLPDGSNAQALIFTVLAAGAIATLTTYRRSKQRPFIPQLSLQPSHFQDGNLKRAGFQNGDLQKARFKSAGLAGNLAQSLPQNLQLSPADSGSTLMALQPTQYLSISKLLEANAAPRASMLGFSTVVPSVSSLEIKPMDVITAVSQLPADSEAVASDVEKKLLRAGSDEDFQKESDDAFEARILTELQDITGQSVRLVEGAAEATGKPLEDSLTVEMASHELNEMLTQATAEESLNQEIKTRLNAPVKVSLDDVDLLADRAVDWILEDLGLSPMAAELDKAEREQAEARRQAIATINEAAAAGKAIDIESLEIQPLDVKSSDMESSDIKNSMAQQVGLQIERSVEVAVSV